MSKVYTNRITYRGADRLDTTVKSGVGVGRLLAPTWNLVGGVKRYETQCCDPRWLRYEPLSHEQYVEGYYALLRARYLKDAAPFVELIQRERLVICCYCAADTFCHRHLAVDILVKVAAAHGLPCERGGELPIG